MHLARRRAQQLSRVPDAKPSCTHSSKPQTFRSSPHAADFAVAVVVCSARLPEKSDGGHSRTNRRCGQAHHLASTRDTKFESLESCYAVVEMAVSVIRSIVLCMGVVSTDIRGHHCHRKGLASLRCPRKPPLNAKYAVPGPRARAPTLPRAPGPREAGRILAPGG